MCMSYYIIIAILLMCAYLIGSIPTGYWLARLLGVDITLHGSGNIGASNIGRVLGKRYFLPIFLIDSGKAYGVLVFCTYITSSFLPEITFANDVFTLYMLASLAILIGNSHSIFMKFRGGKGVATLVGIILFLYPVWLACVFALCWLLALVITKVPAVASAVALVILVGFGAIIYWIATITLVQFCFLIFLAFWISWRHIYAYYLCSKRETS